MGPTRMWVRNRGCVFTHIESNVLHPHRCISPHRGLVSYNYTPDVRGIAWRPRILVTRHILVTKGYTFLARISLCTAARPSPSSKSCGVDVAIVGQRPALGGPATEEKKKSARPLFSSRREHRALPQILIRGVESQLIIREVESLKTRQRCGLGPPLATSIPRSGPLPKAISSCPAQTHSHTEYPVSKAIDAAAAAAAAAGLLRAAERPPVRLWQ